MLRRHGFDGRSFKFDIPVPGVGGLYGNVLTARAVLPATVASAAVGRMLGDVVEVPPCLSGRRILECVTGHDVTILVFEPDEATIDELIADLRVLAVAAILPASAAC